jgi:hypothetical protein
MFKRLQTGHRISITLPVDQHGLTSRKCPNEKCNGVFKVKFGTGLNGDDLPCHCPYCGFTGDTSDFNTPEQQKYIEAVALRYVQGVVHQDLVNWGRKLERSMSGGFLSTKVEANGPFIPLHHYQEQQIETFVTCEKCTLEYAIFGVFAFCPDCGSHNSLQILNKNLELVQKLLDYAATLPDQEISYRLIENALENAVSAFDAFGRATCAAFYEKAVDHEKAKEVSFQNISGAQMKIITLFCIDIASAVDPDQWASVKRSFQKRHLIAHKMGVIDNEYIKKANDPAAIAGRKIVIRSDEITELSQLLATIGKQFYVDVSKLS